MKRASAQDRRRYPRFPEVLEVQARELPPVGAYDKSKAPILGRIQNVSRGGICLWSRQPVVLSSLLRCEIAVSELPVAVPSLLKVCWTHRQKIEPDSYLSGLQFVI